MRRMTSPCRRVWWQSVRPSRSDHNKGLTTMAIKTIKTEAAYGSYEEGQTLTKQADIVAYFVAAAGDGEEQPIIDALEELSPKAVMNILNAAGETEDERMKALFQHAKGLADHVTGSTTKPDLSQTTGSPQQVASAILGPSISATTKERNVSLLAMRMDNDTALASLFSQTVAAKEFLARSARLIMEHFRSTYGVPEMNKWPIPGTQDDPKEPDYSADRPDYFNRPSKGKGGGTASVSWIDLFAEGFKPVRDYRKLIEDTKAAEARKEITGANMDGLIAKYEKRISTIKGKVRLAIDLHHHLVQAETYPAFIDSDEKSRTFGQCVGFEWIMDKVRAVNPDGSMKVDPVHPTRPIWEETITEAEDCIWIIDLEATKAADKFRGPYTIASFCRFDFVAALAAGGTLQNLFDTVKRDEESGVGWRLDLSEDDGMVSVFHAFSELDRLLQEPANRKAINSALFDAGEQNDVVLAHMDHVFLKLAEFLPSFRDRIDAYNAKVTGDAKEIRALRPSAQGAPLAKVG